MKDYIIIQLSVFKAHVKYYKNRLRTGTHKKLIGAPYIVNLHVQLRTNLYNHWRQSLQ